MTDDITAADPAAAQPTLHELPPAWRQRAGELRRFAPSAAEAFTAAADELAAAIAASEDALLSLEAAARECGYSADHLGVLVKEGKLTNHGRKHAPKVRRGDLPRKPAAAVLRTAMRRRDRTRQHEQAR